MDAGRDGSTARLWAAALVLGVVACSCVLAAHWVSSRPHETGEPAVSLAALDQTLVRVPRGEPLDIGALVATDGKPLGRERLLGRWSLVFFGFTECPHICPTTLQTLAEFARQPASGIESGATQVLFVSVDPDNDTPQRIAAYLQGFDRRFVGLTGGREAVARFSAAAGAGYAAAAGGMDHSTSLFVVGPDGRLAGVLLRPADRARILADLSALRG
jgi:protein SCO1/2